MKIHPLLLCVPLLAAGLTPLGAWDYHGHRIINQVALAALPEDFPGFVREPGNAGRIAFLAGEPDRWRNNPDASIKHSNSPDHYLDLERLAEAGLTPEAVSPMRLVFATQFAAGRIVNPAAYAPIDPARNSERTREWPGFAPWAVAEHYGKLKSGFASLKAYEEHGGTAEEIAHARASIVYIMGVMGHYVGDCAQPLHTTMHHNGWVGENPNGYTRKPGIHRWIDGGFVAQAGITFADVAPRVEPAQTLATAGDGDALFAAIIGYVVAQHRQVEPLYALEKAGKFKPGPATDAEGRAFIEGQFLRGGHMLAALWVTAWRTAPPDNYLQEELARRTAATP